MADRRPRPIIGDRTRACGGIGRRARLRALWGVSPVGVRVSLGALDKAPEMRGFFHALRRAEILRPGMARRGVGLLIALLLGASLAAPTGAAAAKKRRLRLGAVRLPRCPPSWGGWCGSLWRLVDP